MNFMKASTRLIDRTTLSDLAAELGVSATLLSQARFPVRSPAHRSPPDGWEAALVKLARQRALELTDLADRLTPAAAPRRVQRSARRRPRRSSQRRN